MSEHGWTTGTAEPPIQGLDEEVRPLTQGNPTADGHSNGDDDATSGRTAFGSAPVPRRDDPAAIDPDADAPRRPAARNRLGGLSRLKTEARFGIAALLSFLILVTVLVVNKGKTTPRPGKKPPLATIPSQPAQAQAPSSPTDPANAKEPPAGEPVASQAPPAPPPFPAGSAPDNDRGASGATHGPAATVAEPGADRVEVTKGETPPPPLPPPSPDASLSVPGDLPPLNDNAVGTPVAGTGLDAAVGLMTSSTSDSLPPAPGPAEMLPSPPGTDHVPPSADASSHLEVPPMPPVGSPATESAPTPAPPAVPEPAPMPAPEPAPPAVPGPASVPAAPEPSTAGLVGDEVAPATMPPFNQVPPIPIQETEDDAHVKPSQTAAKEENRGPQAKRRQPPSKTHEAPATTPKGEVPSSPASASTETFGAEVTKAPTANPFADRADGAGAGAGHEQWVSLPNTASRSAIADSSSMTTAKGANASPGVAGVRDGSAGRDGGDRVEPVPHIVQSGENFWTIARLYYGSGRFYKALWKANSEHVVAPEKLRVGQTIRIPPPESLDRSLVLPPRAGAEGGAEAVPDASPSVHRASRPVPDTAEGRPSGVDLALPVADPFAVSDRRRDVRKAGDLAISPDEPERDRPRLKVYKVRPRDTVRSIARDTLGESRRADEILELNRNVIDDPLHLTTGQIIDLPEDARLSRRAR